MPDEFRAQDMLPSALKQAPGQERVQQFLGAALQSGRLSHAYLFVGAPGVGKVDMARALAQCIVCPHGGCGCCDECIRVAHGTHPDVQLLRPDSASGYLVEQARTLVGEVSLAPVRSHTKIYIITQAELLRDAAANALLKTIEEPPAYVLFILCARSVETVLPTIASRCQQVPFMARTHGLAEQAVERLSGIGGWEARAALSITRSPGAAAEFLSSPDRRACRRRILRSIAELERDDAWDILMSAREIVTAVRIPLDEVRSRQEEAVKEQAEFLSPSARKLVEDADKRELTARERLAMLEVLATVESILRDVLLRCEGVDEPITNEDVADVIDRICAATTLQGVLRALEAVRRCASMLNRNVNPQLALEVMLLTIKEALYAHRYSGEV